MFVEYGEYENGPELQQGALIDSHDTLWLISDAEIDIDDDQQVQLDEIDSQPGRMRLHYDDDPDTDGIVYTDIEYDTLRDARLAYGLRLAVGDWTEPEGGAVPLDVATAGQEAIAAYLHVTQPRYSRSVIADKMDVSKQTISNYWNRMRWKPDQ